MTINKLVRGALIGVAAFGMTSCKKAGNASDYNFDGKLGGSHVTYAANGDSGFTLTVLNQDGSRLTFEDDDGDLPVDSYTVTEPDGTETFYHEDNATHKSTMAQANRNVDSLKRQIAEANTAVGKEYLRSRN